MKRELFEVGQFYHIVERGCKKMDIVHDNEDRWDFLNLLFYLNDENTIPNLRRKLYESKCGNFERPSHWPARELLINICAYCLHDNHFHLLVQEIKEGGITNFMRRLPNSMTLRYNDKYDGSGTLFQGPYGLRLIDSDHDLRNVFLYITAKNVMERFPDGGIVGASEYFEEAWKWALTDSFSSFADYAGDRNSPILSKGILSEKFTERRYLKKEVKNYITQYVKSLEREELGRKYGSLTL